MAQPLPRLRMNLDFMPSPVADRPGLLIRDPFQYSDVTLIIPPVLVQCLEFFDGEQTELDLREALVRLTGQLDVGDVLRHLKESLDNAGFLENATHERLREARERAFAASPVRLASHAGSAYPEEPEALRATFARYLADGGAAGEPLAGIAAPHVSPEGGWQSYRAAYAGLRREDADRTIVLLGTSHYGQPDRFGLTRKPFHTPWGEALTDTAIVDELARAAPEAVLMEDYCHAVEHSIEFQVVFLQSVLGSQVRIVPILCGSFGRSLLEGGLPGDLESNRRFFDALRELDARMGGRLLWVLGVDMAHMGRRYQDAFAARARQGEMAEVEARDRARIERVNAGDARGFWELVRPNQDDLKWCGSAPIYTFLEAVPAARGQLARYDQWNIDPQSVVSFAGIRFHRAA